MRNASLWLAYGVLTCVACVGSSASLTRKPGVERLLAESRAALAALDWERARELADEAVELDSGSASATAWAERLHAGDSPWEPPELSQPRPPAGPHVVPGALLFVSVPRLPLADSPTSGETGEEYLLLGTAVSVSRVEGGLAHVRRVGVRSLLRPGAPPQWAALPLPPDARASEGDVDARFLDASPIDLEALRRQVHTQLTSGSREEALRGMEFLLFAGPWDPELPREMHRLALELEDIPAAVRAARAASEEAPEPPSFHLELSLLYGCRGKLFMAALQQEDKAGPEPADACVTDVDITRPLGVVQLANCWDGNPQDEEQRAFRALVIEKSRQREKEDEVRYEREWAAYHARLEGLRERYPQGPFLCVTASYRGEGARWNVPVQLYSMSSNGDAPCRTSVDEPEVEATPALDTLHLEELRVPYVAPGDTLQVCAKVSDYAEMFFGALMARDVEAAADFVRRRERARQAAEQRPWGEEGAQRRQALEAISDELSDEHLNTASGPTCNMDCY